MTLFQKRIQKRRMPGERIAGYVRIIEFNKNPKIWLPQFEAVLHKIVRFEFYLDRVPDNLALPKYRAIVVKIIFRMLARAFPNDAAFSRNSPQPDPRILQVLKYIKQADLQRRQALYEQYPITSDNVKAILAKLKEEREI